MKIIIPFLILTGAVWTWGLSSPEESNDAVSYAGTVSASNLPHNSAANQPLLNSKQIISPPLISQPFLIQLIHPKQLNAKFKKENTGEINRIRVIKASN